MFFLLYGGFMFNLNCEKSIELVSVLNDLRSPRDRQVFLDANCSEKRVIGDDKFLYIFDDGSFLFVGGGMVKARSSSEDISEFLI